MLWFVALALLGAAGIAGHPEVLRALWPGYALAFLFAHPQLGFFALGAVFLVVTGAEALYADVGHFGRRPVRIGWFAVAMPALVINYFGQGALLLADAAAVRNPFYLLAPGWALLPLVVLATAATVIASQAVITGVYSITSQAIQLGYAPRMTVRHTSGAAMGQIYVPAINAALLVAVLALVLTFRSSSGLASAYGIAVSGTMFVTTVFAYLVASTSGAGRARSRSSCSGCCSPWTWCSLFRQLDQDRGRRLVPAGVRCRRAAAAHHVEARARGDRAAPS